MFFGGICGSEKQTLRPVCVNACIYADWSELLLWACGIFEYCRIPKTNKGIDLFEFVFYGPVNTVKIMSSRSVNLLTLSLGRHSPFKRLTSTLCILSSVTNSCWVGNDRRNDFMTNLRKLCDRAGIRTCGLWICSHTRCRLHYGARQQRP